MAGLYARREVVRRKASRFSPARASVNAGATTKKGAIVQGRETSPRAPCGHRHGGDCPVTARAPARLPDAIRIIFVSHRRSGRPTPSTRTRPCTILEGSALCPSVSTKWHAMSLERAHRPDIYALNTRLCNLISFEMLFTHDKSAPLQAGGITRRRSGQRVTRSPLHLAARSLSRDLAALPDSQSRG